MSIIIIIAFFMKLTITGLFAVFIFTPVILGYYSYGIGKELAKNYSDIQKYKMINSIKNKQNEFINITYG